MKTVQLGLIVSFLTGIALAGLVKRDTIEENLDGIAKEVGNALDKEKNEMENLIEKLKGLRCMSDEQCMEPLQFCNKELGVNLEKGLGGLSVDIPHCVYHIWVYIALAAVVVLFLLLVCVCCACLPCCCCYSLCRKK
jgi:hypothetical protein